MKKVFYKFSTPYGNYGELSKEGYVLKYSNGLDKTKADVRDLKTWQVVGLRELLKFNQLGRLIPLSEAVNIKEFAFKNGNPRYTAEDIDHGTHRVWGNTKYHGIRSLYTIKED